MASTTTTMNPTMTATASAPTELTEPSASTRAALHEREHSACFACGTATSGGLGLSFELSPEGAAVLADWCPPAWSISYDHTMHGGLIATVLDSAMVHALFALNCCAHTAELRIRYRLPVRPAHPCSIRARLIGRRGPSHQLEATLHQAGQLCARATATFMRRAPATPAPTPTLAPTRLSP